MNQILTISTPVSYITANVYNSLFRLDPQRNFIPDLATSVDVSSDYAKYTFHLRQGVKFHDGSPFTSADAKFSVQTAAQLSAYVGQTLKTMTSIDTPDDHTMVINLSAPNYFILISDALATYYTPMLPQKLWDPAITGTDIASNPLNLAPVGTGPFKFSNRIALQEVDLVKNPDYFKPGLPYLDKIVVSVIPDTSTQILTLEQSPPAGQATMIPNFLPLKSYNDVKAKGLQVQVTNATSIRVLYMNQHASIPAGGAGGGAVGGITDNPLAHLQVRQAIATTLNKTQINATAMYGIGIALNQMIPPPDRGGNAAWNNPALETAFPTDVNKANQMLDQAGFPKDSSGKRFDLTTEYAIVTAEDFTRNQVIQNQLLQVGINVIIRQIDQATQYKNLASGTFQLVTAFLNFAPEPYVWANGFATSAQGTAPLVNNWGYSNPTLDGLFVKVQQTGDKSQRAQMYQQMSQILVAQDTAVIPLGTNDHASGWTPNLMNWNEENYDSGVQGGGWESVWISS